MAGANQPWYMPITWPLGHVSAAITKDDKEKPGPPSATPYLDLTGNLTAVAAAARSWSLAYLCIFWLPGKYGQVYPAFGPGAEFQLSWMMPIIIRNIVATLVICGFWDWFLYFSPLSAKVRLKPGCIMFHCNILGHKLSQILSIQCRHLISCRHF